MKNLIPAAAMLCLFAGASPVFAHSAEDGKATTRQDDGRKKTAGAAYSRVEPNKVCMLNEMVFEKVQIPVIVDGKTYYGCCETCREALQKNPEKRYAIDPVTGAKVDKAVAIIASNADGAVLYFESMENLDYYNKREATQKQ